jgi:hypothetical protein
LGSLVIVQPIPTRVRGRSRRNRRNVVKASAVLVIETVSIVAKDSNIRAIDRAPHFPSNRNALARFRRP